MHVRGFTRHSSSGVKGKGTFDGVIEKIPYLKDLGITTVELQPIYEFNEMPEKNTNAQVQQLLLETPKLNYWGYQDAYYYATKQAYAYKADASMECKDMIKTFHQKVFIVYHLISAVAHNYRCVAACCHDGRRFTFQRLT